MLPDDYPTGEAGAQRYPGDLNGIETTIDQIFEGISQFYNLVLEIVFRVGPCWRFQCELSI